MVQMKESGERFLFSVGEYISYGNNGICKVSEICMMQLAKDMPKKEYYVLQPLHEAAGKIYIAVDNQKVSMRSLIPKEEAIRLLEEAVSIAVFDEKNPRETEEEYKSALRSGDWNQWMRIVKTVRIKKKSREDQGKKMTASDERYLREATEKLTEELGFVLELDKEETCNRLSAALMN